MAEPVAGAAAAAVLRCGEIGTAAVAAIADRFGAEVVALPAGAPIPGSYWGAPEAGVVGHRLYLRPDTPVHSALHELSHWVCATPRRRAAFDTDAGGSAIEECAVCYLQLLLADALEGFGADRAVADMDCWGYSFREGSTAAWFAGDGRDAREWLARRGLIDETGRPTWCLRGGAQAARCYAPATSASSSPVARR